MKNLSIVLVVAAAAGLAGCNLATDGTSLFDDATLTTDVADISGDAIATSVETMLANEIAAFLPSPPALATPPDNSLNFSRTRTCYDAGGVVVAGCSPMSSVRRVLTHVTIDGSRTGTKGTTGGTGSTWTGAVHRVIDDELIRNFNGPTETSRTHNATSVGHDSTSFTDANVNRTLATTSHDAANGLTWNLPRSSNPFPVSGNITRVDSVHASFTRGGTTETRDVVRTVRVDFPADAQGNVVLKVNDKTCNLNLVTHTVSNCN